VLYIRGHEGRGIGLLHKLQAYQLQDTGMSHAAPRPPADARDHGTGAQILVDLGIHTMRLLTTDLLDQPTLAGYGLSALPG
jgi:3,4-dihydroxy 2-butanone 4-phosphate synthase/GTP cyclohydrolase II